MRRQRNAKILATLGPASSSKEMIRQLFRAGADVFRLNFSHGSHDDHRERYETIRAIEDELERPIGILADMQGPKLRVGKLKDGEAVLTARSEEHTSELQSLMRHSYAVFCLKKKKTK